MIVAVSLLGVGLLVLGAGVIAVAVVLARRPVPQMRAQPRRSREFVCNVPGPPDERLVR